MPQIPDPCPMRRRCRRRRCRCSFKKMGSVVVMRNTADPRQLRGHPLLLQYKPDQIFSISEIEACT